MSDVDKVLSEVAAERARQDKKWGEQNHPSGTGAEVEVLRPLAYQHGYGINTSPAKNLAAAAKLSTDDAAKRGRVTFADILLEEVFEALAEDPNSTALRTELVQVAAVATQWVEAIDRANMAADDALANT